MLEIIPSPDHVAAYRISGTLTGEEYDRIVADLEAKLSRHDKLGVFVDLTGFDDMTFDAGLKDARYALTKLFQMGRFPREAVVTDKQWVRSLCKAASPFLPGVDLRTFAPEEAGLALEWRAKPEVQFLRRYSARMISRHSPSSPSISDLRIRRSSPSMTMMSR